MTDLFEAPAVNPDPETDPIEAVRQKFMKDGQVDIDALLKAKAESDKFIKRLENENALAREEVTKAATFEDLLAKISEQQAAKAAANHADEPGQAPNVPTNATTPEEVRQWVAEQYNQEQTKAAQQKNVESVRATMEKSFGPNFQGKLEAICRDLELTKEEAGFMAATRPKAFLKLVLGAQAPAQYNTAPPASSVRVEAGVKRGGDRTYSYYKAMASSPDPKVRAQYLSPGIQNKIARLHEELGDDFLNN
jgi:hypothetical protein